MTTLLTALFYLWLVITILLVAMWFLRRQDQAQGSDEEDELYGRSTAAGTAPGPEHAEVTGGAAGSTKATTPERSHSADQPLSAGRPNSDRPNPNKRQPARPDPGKGHRADPNGDGGARGGAKSSNGGKPITGAKSSTGGKTSKGGKSSNGRKTRTGRPQNVGRGPKSTTGEATTGYAKPRSQSGPHTVATLLSSLTLPYDLTPTTDRIPDPDRHAILVSPHNDAEAVGTAFADELVKRGFDIEPDSLDRARAIRGDLVIMLRISPNAGSRGSGDFRRYPTAGKNDVAIEIWTGQDLPPRLGKPR